MKYIISCALALGCTLLLSIGAHAQEAYQYVDQSGMLRTVIADNATEAITTAPNRNPNSGVMLLGGVGGGNPINPGTLTGTNTYQYVDMTGMVQEVEATSPQQALDMASVKLADSGVILVKPGEAQIPIGFRVQVDSQP